MTVNIRKIIIIAIIAIVITLAVLYYIDYKYPIIIVDMPKFTHQPKEQISTSTLVNLNLPVPFTAQAPTANWDALHEEACEEASAIMVAEYFKNNKEVNLKPELVEKQISALIEWENKNYGYNLDITSEETAKMIKEVYGLKTKLIKNFTADNLKSELAQNHLIMLSEYGRGLNNPNFKIPGPIHHMLVVRGYVDNGFLTNDPGTRKGLNYFYTFNTLYEASADWNHQAKTVDQTQKIAIIIWQ